MHSKEVFFNIILILLIFALNNVSIQDFKNKYIRNITNEKGFFFKLLIYIFSTTGCLAKHLIFYRTSKLAMFYSVINL
jgi:hypothetical protein